MYKEKLPAILEILIPQVIQYIMNTKNIGNKDAAELLYESALYETLEKEESKLWHLSVPTLCSLFDDEFTTGQINYPEGA